MQDYILANKLYLPTVTSIQFSVLKCNIKVSCDALHIVFYVFVEHFDTFFDVSSKFLMRKPLRMAYEWNYKNVEGYTTTFSAEYAGPPFTEISDLYH